MTPLAHCWRVEIYKVSGASKPNVEDWESDDSYLGFSDKYIKEPQRLGSQNSDFLVG